LQLAFCGTVYSGKGEGKKFVALPWVQRQIKQKLGFSPFPGTLNLHLDAESQKKRSQLDKSSEFTIHPEDGFFVGKLFAAQIGNVFCAVVLPVVPNYPVDVLEIVAENCLREKLKIKDGSCVSVLVTV
jgi:riboflavin kinase, archaea type